MKKIVSTIVRVAGGLIAGALVLAAILVAASVSPEDVGTAQPGEILLVHGDIVGTELPGVVMIRSWKNDHGVVYAVGCNLARRPSPAPGFILGKTSSSTSGRRVLECIVGQAFSREALENVRDRYSWSPTCHWLLIGPALAGAVAVMYMALRSIALALLISVGAIAGHTIAGWIPTLAEIGLLTHYVLGAAAGIVAAMVLSKWSKV